MTKPGFNWVTPIFCVTDLAKSLTHYRDVLGFDISWTWSEEDAFEEEDRPTFACVCRGKCSLFLCEKGQGNPGGWVYYDVKTAADLQTIYLEYQASGADIAAAPEDYSWGMRELIVRDLDGNTFRIGCQSENGDDNC